MFSLLFFWYSDDHSQSVVSAMQTIMVVIIEESEELQENLLLTILSALGRKKPVSSFPLHFFYYIQVFIFFMSTFCDCDYVVWAI